MSFFNYQQAAPSGLQSPYSAPVYVAPQPPAQPFAIAPAAGPQYPAMPYARPAGIPQREKFTVSPTLTTAIEPPAAAFASLRGIYPMTQTRVPLRTIGGPWRATYQDIEYPSYAPPLVTRVADPKRADPFFRQAPLVQRRKKGDYVM
eukprot:NODE_5958_length_621_cov_21.416084_g5556_i0.p2 GENE.NODE_5958_length_621_cov_21.416084_g5556_i0~~NODE_5958_length_621_cov_21.416084_g5556_i0.p2  ORF type:complete len:147 (+),score=19.28 NODE_5958_length_621_cov_21.416084_g5556_i0:80-520(+)